MQILWSTFNWKGMRLETIAIGRTISIGDSLLMSRLIRSARLAFRQELPELVRAPALFRGWKAR
jgi:hypothetical protein